MTVIQLAEHRTAPRTPIEILSTVISPHDGRPMTGRAVSTDGVWAYDWLLDELLVTHNPTGFTEQFRNLADALVWTGDEVTALDELHRFALAQLGAEFVLQSERDRARRALMLWAGTLLPYTTNPDHIETRCADPCGGYLAYAARRVLVHVDTCAEELHAPGQPCPDDRNTHKVCEQPAAAVCDHQHCLAPGQVHAAPCLMGHDVCCGCCNGGA